MSEIRRILFATDFSDCSHRARDLACEFAEKFHAELHVLHVVHNLAVEVPDFGMGLAFPGYVENLAEIKRELAAKAQESLAAELRKRWKQDHKVTFAIQFGQPAPEIADYARKNGIDLIVIGTHGRAGLQHAVLGSVAERVVQLATCPVTTVRSAH